MALAAVVVAGLLARRRTSACVSLPIYLTVVAVADALMVAWPKRFFTPAFYMQKEIVINLVIMAMALELLHRIFRPFPRAHGIARRGTLLVVLALAALVGGALLEGAAYRQVVGRLNPLLTDGSVWLMATTGLLAVWYHLPLDAIQKAILLGLVPYLLVFSVISRVVVAIDWHEADAIISVAPLCYIGMLAYWTAVAWERDRGDGDGP